MAIQEILETQAVKTVEIEILQIITEAGHNLYLSCTISNWLKQKMHHRSYKILRAYFAFLT